MQAIANAAANTLNTATGPPNAMTGGTISGARIEPMRPNDAPAPVPVPRMAVG